jgi:hypothetical protein
MKDKDYCKIITYKKKKSHFRQKKLTGIPFSERLQQKRMPFVFL